MKGFVIPLSEEGYNMYLWESQRLYVKLDFLNTTGKICYIPKARNSSRFEQVEHSVLLTTVPVSCSTCTAFELATPHY